MTCRACNQNDPVKIPDKMSSAGCPDCKQKWTRIGFYQPDKTVIYQMRCPHCSMKYRDCLPEELPKRGHC